MLCGGTLWGVPQPRCQSDRLPSAVPGSAEQCREAGNNTWWPVSSTRRWLTSRVSVFLFSGFSSPSLSETSGRTREPRVVSQMKDMVVVVNQPRWHHPQPTHRRPLPLRCCSQAAVRQQRHRNFSNSARGRSLTIEEHASLILHHVKPCPADLLRVQCV